jgi:tryptophan synthase alpha chain
MSRIAGAFQKGKAFIGFVTGGDPTLAASEDFILQMSAAGADIIEIGIPFSDPIAEGPVIQQANIRALSHGTTVDDIFTLVRRVREQSEVPLVLLTYLNPVFHYGYPEFCARCRETGVDGLIIPDLPFEEQAELRGFTDAHDLDLISMIAPTSEERITAIAKGARGFLYIVSSMGVTGVRSALDDKLAGMLAAVRLATNLPAAIGFGIHTPAQAAELSALADGVIVGSAIVKIIAAEGEKATAPLRAYVQSMKSALSR